MKCLVCDSGMQFFMKKHFSFLGLGEVEYHKCVDCGFVASRTHHMMERSRWIELNSAFHRSRAEETERSREERWLQRLSRIRDSLARFIASDVVPGDGMLIDYACGTGQLSDWLEDAGISLLRYDPFMGGGEGWLEPRDLSKGCASLVVNSAMFEHVHRRQELDDVVDLLDEDGVLALHTLVREEIPCDPTWFYLKAVHCAFFTNEAMRILFDAWGFRASVYDVDARLWYFLKKPIAETPHLDGFLAGRSGLVAEDGFVAYWK